MDARIAEQAVHETGIAYALTDRSLVVVDVGGALSTFAEVDQTWVGLPLPDLVPELFGSEDILGDVLSGELSRFRLAKVNRETNDGAICYVDLIELPYRDETGQVTGLVHLVQDVSETGTLEQQVTQERNTLELVRRELHLRNLELAAVNAELERLDDLKTQFISVAAHELRNPLTAILGYVEMFLEDDFGPLSDEQREFLGLIYGAGRRLLTITNDLLDVTRIEAGRIDLVLQPLDLEALVHGVVSEYRVQRENKRQHLEFHAATDLPTALCDETRATQIVGNLVSNAIKYTEPEGRITVRVEQAGVDGFVQVSVADTGMGISAEDQSMLFRRFYRTEQARSSGTGGTGLGLNVTRSLVELHGGEIWLESELDKGSTFYVTFAVADEGPSF
jgi:signal transduction histidine kinase